MYNFSILHKHFSETRFFFARKARFYLPCLSFFWAQYTSMYHGLCASTKCEMSGGWGGEGGGGKANSNYAFIAFKILTWDGRSLNFPFVCFIINLPQNRLRMVTRQRCLLHVMWISFYCQLPWNGNLRDKICCILCNQVNILPTSCWIHVFPLVAFPIIKFLSNSYLLNDGIRNDGQHTCYQTRNR